MFKNLFARDGRTSDKRAAQTGPERAKDLLAAARAERAERRGTSVRAAARAPMPAQRPSGASPAVARTHEAIARPFGPTPIGAGTEPAGHSSASPSVSPHASDRAHAIAALPAGGAGTEAALARRGSTLPDAPGPCERPIERFARAATAMDGGGRVGARELVDGVDPSVLAYVSAQYARDMQILPFRLEGTVLHIAVGAPLARQSEQQVRWIVGLCRSDVTVSFALADPAVLARAVDAHYPPHASTGLAVASLGDLAAMFGGARAAGVAALGQQGTESTRGLVEHLLCLAVQHRASDILVDVWETDLVVRFKVDGSCETVLAGLPAHAGPQVISVVKQMARLKIFETEAQQSGGYEATVVFGDRPRRVEFRVEVTPTIYGESCSIRVHDAGSRRACLASLGADARTVSVLRHTMRTRRGMLVLSGPTESGKTTTLYAALGEVDLARENVVAIEDPVEIRVRGVRPIQVNEAKGVTFASSLRSILRQNPDRILIGEIRDRETANLAVFAALTGHQVLTTVHADDAPRTVVRMLKEGIEPHNLATILDAVVAQRLVGRTCEMCSEEVAYAPETLLAAQFASDEIGAVRARRGRGCKVCRGTGVDGRVALHETLWITEEARAAIEGGSAGVERTLRRLGAESGMRPLRRMGLDHVKAGAVSLEQVLMSTPPMPVAI